MNEKNFLIILAVAIAILVFSGTLFGAIFRSSAEETSLPDETVISTVGETAPLPEAVSSGELPAQKKEIPTITKTEKVPVSYFGHLAIPKIKVDANIQEVGISQKGDMAVPTNFTDVGWYKYGTLPGEKGSAVIAGHVSNKLSFPAVFSNLKNLEIGDEVYVTSGDNVKRQFIVSKISTYDFDAMVEEIFTDDSGKFIQLITCTGTWNATFKTRNQRLVVTAELKE